MKPQHGAPSNATKPHAARNSSWGVIAALGIAAAGSVVFVLITFLAFRAGPEADQRVEVPAFSETGGFDYTITMQPSALYPDGILRPPSVPAVVVEGPAETAVAAAVASPATESESAEPAFTSLAEELLVDFHYALTAPGPVEASGTLAAELVIAATGEGWTRTTPIVAPEPFEGASVARSMVINLADIATFIATVEEQTGYASTSYEISVVPRVVVEGSHSEVPFSSVFEERFTLQYDKALITPPVELSTTRPTTTTEQVSVPRKLSLLAWSLDVSSARLIGLGGLAVFLGAAVGLGGMLVLRLRNDEHERIRARYGSRLMDVHTISASERERIGVASMRDLARVSERLGVLVLHETTAEGHRYFVRDGDDTYEYVSTSHATGPREATIERQEG